MTEHIATEPVALDGHVHIYQCSCGRVSCPEMRHPPRAVPFLAPSPETADRARARDWLWRTFGPMGLRPGADESLAKLFDEVRREK